MSSTQPNVNSSNFLTYGGGALDQDQQTANAWGVAIATGAGIFLAQAFFFQLFRGSIRFKRIYQPKTYLVPERHKAEPSPNNPWKWFQRIWHLSKSEIIAKSGLDTFVFLKYFRMLLKVFIPLAVLVPIVLLPINLVHGNNQKQVPLTDPPAYYNITGLNTLAWGNVDASHPNLYWGHCIMALVVIVWCCYVFFDELIEFIQARQEYLTSPEHRLKASASTVLIMNIPPEFQSEKALLDLFDVFPGGIRKIWVNRNFDALAYKVSRRRDILSHLEDGETNLIRKANQQHRNEVEKQQKKDKKSKTSEEKAKSTGTDSQRQANSAHSSEGMKTSTELQPYPERFRTDSDISSERARPQSSDSPTRMTLDGVAVSTAGSQSSLHPNEQNARDEDGKAEWQKYLKKGDRESIWILRWGWTFFTSVPTWILIGLPFTKPVDRIYYSRQELAKLNHEIEKDQENLDNFPILNSAFIQFHNQAAAHMCVQTTTHHMPALMNPRLVEIAPSDVLWENLSLAWWHKRIRQTIVFGVFVGILFLWGVPFVLIGFISNISTIGSSVSWLAWVSDLPKPALNVIQGLLPSLLTQLLITLGLPALLRWLCHLSGVPSRTMGENLLQHYYFAFLFIEVFLVSTVSSGLTAVIQEIVLRPYSIASILANNLPKASNYFLSYVVLQALSWSAGQLLQTGRLFVVGWRLAFLNPKSRTLFFRKIFLQHNKWGNLFPFFTNMACIALIYSVISPLILIEVLLTFGLFWLVYRNNSMFVYRNTIDSTGSMFPTAVFQLFTGIYFLELALIGLFFLARKPGSNELVCYPQAITMIVIAVLTIGYHWALYSLVAPLLKNVPITLEDDAVIRDEKYHKELLKRVGLEGEEPERATSFDGSVAGHADDQMPNGADDMNEKSETTTKWYQRHAGREGTGEGQEKIMTKLRLRLARNEHDEKTNGRAHNTETHDAGGLLDDTDDVLRRLRQRRERKSADKERREALEAEHGNVKGEDSIPGILANFNDELGDLLPSDRDALVDVAYTNPAMRDRRPIVWLPQDDLGVAEDEIKRMQSYSKNISASTKGAYFKEKSLACGITEAPPDFSEFWLIEPEL